LQEAGLEQYTAALLQAGFDDIEVLLLIEDSDLRDLGFVRGHVVKLRKRLREYAEHAAPPPLAPARPAPERPFAPQRHLRAAVGTPSLADIFSQRRVSLVENSWEQVRALGMPTVGGILCRHTLELVPEAKVLFPLDVRRRYREWTAEEGEEDEEVEVLESAAVRQLFGRIITAVGSAVAGIHDMVQLMPMLTKLGARHINYGVSEDHWKVLGEALDMTLHDVLGDAYTAEVQQAWSLVYGFTSAVMIEGLRDAIARA